MRREFEADLKPYGRDEPQAKSWKKDNNKLLAKSPVEQAKKLNMRAVMKEKTHTASSMSAHLRPDQLTKCWPTCNVCGSQRLVDKLFKFAVDSCGDG